jgi:hypothetical protein
MAANSETTTEFTWPTPPNKLLVSYLKERVSDAAEGTAPGPTVHRRQGHAPCEAERLVLAPQVGAQSAMGGDVGNTEKPIPVFETGAVVPGDVH